MMVAKMIVRELMLNTDKLHRRKLLLRHLESFKKSILKLNREEFSDWITDELLSYQVFYIMNDNGEFEVSGWELEITIGGPTIRLIKPPTNSLNPDGGSMVYVNTTEIINCSNYDNSDVRVGFDDAELEQKIEDEICFPW